MWQRNTLLRIWLAAGVPIVPGIVYLLGQRSAGAYIAGYAVWVVLYIAGKLLYRNSERKAAIVAAQQWQQQLTDLKRNATVIAVDLSQCRILTNNYILEHDGYHKPIMAGLNVTSAQQSSNITRQAVLQSQIVFEHNGVQYASPVLPVAKESLLFLFDKQKETKLYVVDEQHYYFDVSFVG